MAKYAISATFSVGAGTTTNFVLDLGDVRSDQIQPAVLAGLVEVFAGRLVDTTLCHQCASNVVDLEVVDLVGFTIDTTEYGYVDGAWVVVER